jgi:hypothetical protein
MTEEIKSKPPLIGYILFVGGTLCVIGAAIIYATGAIYGNEEAWRGGFLLLPGILGSGLGLGMIKIR